MTPATQTAAQAGTTTLDGDAWLEGTLKTMRVDDDAATRKMGTDALGEFIAKVTAGQTVGTDVLKTIKYLIKQIDDKLTAQVNEILHHADFQKLEGTWRGLHYFVSNTETSTQLKIKVLNITKNELSRDLENAVEFDQSHIFKKVYEEEYGTLGGVPYGMLVGDYEFDVRKAVDIGILQKMSGVAAAAHAPFVAGGSAKAFGMESFTELGNPRDLAKIFETAEYIPWQSFRKSPDSRYVALTMPRVLGRLPYGQEFKPVEGFDFEEATDGKEHGKYLWMNAAWTYATRITDAFANYGWLARTRGVEGGGKVEGLPVHTFPNDDGDLGMKCPTEYGISDRRENELSGLGFLPLIHCKGRDYAAFLGAQSCQKPDAYFSADANASAQLSAKFNLILCISRFAHYLKVIMRDKIGSFMERADLEKLLDEWLRNYTLADPALAGDEEKAKAPLQAYSLKVEDVPGMPGHYRVVTRLTPHYQLEGLEMSLRLTAKPSPT